MAIAKREKDDNEPMEEIKATHDRTVFSICNDKTPLVSGAGEEGSITTRAREKHRHNDCVIMRSSTSYKSSSVAIGAAVGSAQGTYMINFYTVSFYANSFPALYEWRKGILLCQIRSYESWADVFQYQVIRCSPCCHCCICSCDYVI